MNNLTSPIKCYLDTNLVGAIITRDLSPPSEMSAVLDIYAYWQKGLVMCYTSETVKQEIEGISDNASYRQPIVTIQSLLTQSVMIEATQVWLSTFGGAPFGAVPFGGGIAFTDPLFLELSGMFRHTSDVKHIFLSIRNQVPYFVTNDRKSILSKAIPHNSRLRDLGIVGSDWR